MQALTFRCPHCGTAVEATADALHKTAVCPNGNCKRPFELQSPRATLVESPDADGPQNVEARPLDDKHLVSEEKTIWNIHPVMFRRHPFRFLAYLLLVAGGLVGALYFLGSENAWLVWAFLAASAAGGFFLLYWWLEVLHVTLTVTTKRTIFRRGIIAKRTSEVRHDDVRNLQLHQTILERVLNVGDLAISSAGQGDTEIEVEGIKAPKTVVSRIRELQG